MQQRTTQILSIALFALLAVWGVYTLIVYLGIPVHGTVFLSGDGQKAVTAACAKDAFFCRGIQAFFPFVAFTIIRMAPFLWYFVICAILFIIFVLWNALRSGSMRLQWTFRPWHFLVAFLGSLWLIFTVLSFSTIGQFPVRMIFEPTAQVYPTVGPQALEQLKQNFNELEAGNCLTPVGKLTSGAGAFTLKNFCMEKAFFTRVMSQVTFILLFLIDLLILGRVILWLLRIRPASLLQEAVLSAAIGACGWIVILWLTAVFSLFIAPVGWALLALVPLLAYRHTLYWLRKFAFHSWTLECDWYDASLFLGWLLISYLAFNFLSVVRPFPIGWDDLGSYLNRPRLMVSYGHFIFSMASFQWEYLTALGFMLYGYLSYFGATASMLINWTEGLIATLSVFLFGSTFFGKRKGLLAALMYYSLPLVGHFSFADMKIDNAVFAMGALATFCVFYFLFPWEEEASSEVPVTQDPGLWLPRGWQWLLLAGIFGGFAFGMKVTAIMVVVSLVAVIAGVTLHWAAFIAVVLLSIPLFSHEGALNIGTVLTRLTGSSAAVSTALIFGISFAGAALILAYAGLMERSKIKGAIVAIFLFCAGFGLSIAPWITHNNYLYGSLPPHIELGAPNTLAPTMNYMGATGIRDVGQDIRTLPKELALDPKNPACNATGGKEELDRYWGFSQGWTHYLTLPWRTVMNLDSVGYYVTTMSALLLFPLLLLLPFFWSRKGKWLRWLFLGTSFIFLQWMFLANGIPWYGVGVFLGLVIGLEALVVESSNIYTKTLASVLIGFSLLGNFSMRFWQFEQQHNLLEYPMGKVSAQALVERTIPHYDNIRDVVLERNASVPKRPYLYRVGTFIPFFIPRNLEMIGITDNQLDTFNCLNQERKPELTLKRLQALGFNSIIFDTNTATIERDPNGSLHQKLKSFVDFINTADLNIKLVVNDPEAGVAYILLP